MKEEMKSLFSPRLFDDENRVYEEMLNENVELSRSISFQMSRLQQLENQSKQIRNCEEKDRKLNEIIAFIDDKCRPLIDEDSICKFFRQKNLSNCIEKDFQSMKTFVLFL